MFFKIFFCLFEIYKRYNLKKKKEKKKEKIFEGYCSLNVEKRSFVVEKMRAKIIL